MTHRTGGCTYIRSRTWACYCISKGDTGRIDQFLRLDIGKDRLQAAAAGGLEQRLLQEEDYQVGPRVRAQRSIGSIGNPSPFCPLLDHYHQWSNACIEARIYLREFKMWFESEPTILYAALAVFSHKSTPKHVKSHKTLHRHTHGVFCTLSRSELCADSV
jgi:hypothetical protein